jgi:hypothetical protein
MAKLAHAYICQVLFVVCEEDGGEDAAEKLILWLGIGVPQVENAG